MIASANADSYRAVLETVLDDPGVDAVIASFVPPLGVHAEDVARAITDTAAGREQPALAVLMGRKGLKESRALLHAASVPAFISLMKSVDRLATTTPTFWSQISDCLMPHRIHRWKPPSSKKWP